MYLWGIGVVDDARSNVRDQRISMNFTLPFELQEYREILNAFESNLEISSTFKREVKWFRRIGGDVGHRLMEKSNRILQGETTV